MQDRSNVDIEKVFSKLPNELFWKMFIDAEYWDKGADVFDKDESKGYLESVSKAFYYNLITINEPLSLELILKLHDWTYHDTYEVNTITNNANSGLALDIVSEDGLVQLIERIRQESIPLSIVARGAEESKKYSFPLIGKSQDLARQIIYNLSSNLWYNFNLRRKSSIQEVKNYIELLINNYEHQIQKISESSNNPDEKIIAIIDFIQRIHQYHPFADGNGRTFIFILLNKLLIMNGLSPTMMENPGRFSGFSMNELVNVVRNAQQLFISQCILTKEKEETLIKFLQNNIVLPVDNNLHLLHNNISKFYEVIGQEHNIQDTLSEHAEFYFENEFISVENKDDIDLVLSREQIKPTMMQNIFINAVFLDNFVLAETILNYKYGNEPSFTKRKNLNLTIQESVDLVLNSKKIDFIELFFRELEIDSYKVKNSLIQNIGNDGEVGALLRNLLAEQNFGLVLILLQKLNDFDFKNLLSAPMYTDSLEGEANAIQLLFILGNEEIQNYLLDRLNNSKSISPDLAPQLLSKRYHLLVEPEISRAADQNFGSYMEKFSKSKSSMLESRGFFSQNQSVDESEPTKKSTVSPKKTS